MKKAVLLALLIIIIKDYPAFAIVFEPGQTISVGSQPEAVAIADLNGDGRNAVIMTTSLYYDPARDYKIHIFYQDNTGNLQSPVTYNGGNGHSVAIGDINNDRRLDIVTSTDSGIGILYQNVDGTFGPMQIIPGPKSYIVKLADLNNDGLIDVVSIGSGTNSVEVYLQNPNGTFSGPVSYSVTHQPWPENLALADVNNDGKLDIVISDPSRMGILIQQNDGTFALPLYLALNMDIKAVAISDINSDGHNEIITGNGGNSPSSNIAIFSQTGSGGFNQPVSFTSYDCPSSIIVTDIDKDGRADIIVRHGCYNAVGYYLQKKDGSFENEELFRTVGDNFNSGCMAAGDINGDGLNDIVLATDGGLMTFRQRDINCTYSLSSTSADFKPSGGMSSFNITVSDPSCQWTASSDSDWLAVISIGTGSSAVTFYARTVNFNATARIGKITIEGQTFTVTQAGCSYALSYSQAFFSPVGGQSGPVSVISSDPQCPWTAVSNSPWMIYIPPYYSYGSGSGGIIFSVSANSNGDRRDGTITIAGQTFTVTQSPKPVSGGAWIDLGELWLNMGSTAAAVSADGNVAVGTARNMDGMPRPFRWTYTGGMFDLGTLGVSMSDSSGGSVSADGNVVVGTTSHYFNNSFSPDRAYRWTQIGGMIDLGVVRFDFFSYGWSVSADGNTTVGYEDDTFTDTWRAIRWTGVGAMDYLGTLPNGYDFSIATSISANGNVIVGVAANSVGDAHAFRWTQADGMVDLGTLDGSYSQANGVSADGQVVVGVATDGGGNNLAFRWTQATGIVSLGTLGGSNSCAYGVSADGNVIVGSSTNKSGGTSAFRWSQLTGMQSISQWLTESGVYVPDLFYEALSASHDGNVIVGNHGSRGGAYIASVIYYNYVLTANTGGSGSGTLTSTTPSVTCNGSSCSGTLLPGSSAIIAASAATGSFLAGWSGCTSVDSNLCTVAMTFDKTVAATFNACDFVLSASYATIAPAGGGKGVNLTAAAAGCIWTAVSNVPWITITSGSSGTGNGDIQYSVASNSGGMRMGTITIAGQTFTVTQGTTLTRAQIGVFRTGAWYVDRDETFGWNGCGPDGCYSYGMAGDQAVTGDWDGTGIVRSGVFRNGMWYLGYNGNGQWSGCGTTPSTDRCYSFGMADDIPVVGDWNGSGVSKIGVFRNGMWYLDYNGDGQWSGCGTTPSTDRCYSFGMADDIPVVGDWNGSGVSKIGVFRNGMWYLDYNGDGQWSGCGTTPSTDRCYSFGMAGDIPVVGDWNGNGAPKIGVFRNGSWYLDYSGINSWVGCGAPADTSKDVCAVFGMSGDLPVVLK